VADSGNHTIRKVTPTGLVSTLAGLAGVSGGNDGSATAARFNAPVGMAADSAGNLYVADSRNHAIRKVTPAGLVSTLAGTAGLSGSADGSGAAALFNYPWGIAADSSGNVYVADTGNNTVRKLTPAGLVSTLAGVAGVSGSVEGSAAAARFNSPLGIAIDSAGNLYVADTSNYTIRKVTSAGLVSTLAGKTLAPGSADGSGAAARFNSPEGIAADNIGNLYVADRTNNTIRKITPTGLVSTLAGTAGVLGSADGDAAAASFFDPKGIAADRAGNLYVADTRNHTIRKITPAGQVSTLAGTARVSGTADGIGVAARFAYPEGVAVDNADNLYVADISNHTIRKITPAGLVSTLAGNAGVSGSADGSAAAASFHSPSGIAVDSTGNLYVTDRGNHTIRKITPAGIVSTLAGNAGALGSADGSGSAARLDGPEGIAVGSTGDLYVADKGNRTIRKITPAGLVSTLAGSVGRREFVAGVLPGGLDAPVGVAIIGTSLYITMEHGVAVISNVP